MEPSELNETEQLVLVGLAKAIVHADQEVSHEETEAIRELAAVVGPELWNQRVAQARERLTSAEHLFDLARSIARIDARRCIHRSLRRIAEADELNHSEQEILEWIAEVWQLGGAVATEEEDPDDDQTYDDEFVLFDLDDEDEEGA